MLHRRQNKPPTEYCTYIHTYIQTFHIPFGEEDIQSTEVQRYKNHRITNQPTTHTPSTTPNPNPNPNPNTHPNPNPNPRILNYIYLEPPISPLQIYPPTHLPTFPRFNLPTIPRSKLFIPSIHPSIPRTPGFLCRYVRITCRQACLHVCNKIINPRACEAYHVFTE